MSYVYSNFKFRRWWHLKDDNFHGKRKQNKYIQLIDLSDEGVGKSYNLYNVFFLIEKSIDFKYLDYCYR